VKVNVWPVAFTRAVTWPVPILIAVMPQQAAVDAAAGAGFVAAGATAGVTAGAVAVTAGVVAVGVGAAEAAAAAPLVIEQQADVPLIETCLLVKLA
jgi:hypothetical protein